METKSLTILINECVILMRGVGYSEKSILKCKQVKNSKLTHFLKSLNIRRNGHLVG